MVSTSTIRRFRGVLTIRVLFRDHTEKLTIGYFLIIVTHWLVQLIMAEVQKCRLIGGLFAMLVQVCLAFVCIGTLIIKRQQETPQRDWLVWFLDATKQGLGSSFGHFSNIYLSMVIAQSLPEADECQWYCTTYVLDATLGTACNLLLLTLFTAVVKQLPQCRDTMEIGEYGNPPQLALYLPQLAVWLVIVVMGKMLMLLSLAQVIVPVDAFLAELFRPLRQTPEIELVTVMIVIPTMLNSLQFWLTDSFLKRSRNSSEDESEGSEGLVTEMTGLRSRVLLDENLLVDEEATVNRVSRHRSRSNSHREQLRERGGSVRPLATTFMARLSSLWPALFPQQRHFVFSSTSTSSSNEDHHISNVNSNYRQSQRSNISSGRNLSNADTYVPLTGHQTSSGQQTQTTAVVSGIHIGERRKIRHSESSTTFSSSWGRSNNDS